MKFALGPTLTARRQAIQDAGGWPALAEFLAEDFVLGHRAARRGWTVILSSYVVEHRIGSQSWRANAAHRLRWYRSTRRSRPAGYVGQLFTNPLPLILLLYVVGRAIFGGFFLYNGINHFIQRNSMSQYAASKGLPVPEAAVLASGAALLFGGASMMTGVQPKLGAAAIAGFLAAASPTMHDFWRQQDEGQRTNDLINFSKNMALLGSALAFMSIREPWPASLHSAGHSDVAVAVERELIAR
jgi:uncharacterized membrane protein YphA (DoxX/SURF4 family)